MRRTGAHELAYATCMITAVYEVSAYATCMITGGVGAARPGAPSGGQARSG